MVAASTGSLPLMDMTLGLAYSLNGWILRILRWVDLSLRECSVPNSSDGLIFVKRRALDGPFLDKNTGFRRAHRRAKFTFLIFSFYLNLPKKSKLSKISFLATLVREGTIKLNVWKY